jgi:hypothetical protein
MAEISDRLFQWARDTWLDWLETILDDPYAYVKEYERNEDGSINFSKTYNDWSLIQDFIDVGHELGYTDFWGRVQQIGTPEEYRTLYVEFHEWKMREGK